MSTNHTTNYNLSQWEPDDKVLRTDFNADNLAIDTALKNLNTSLSGKASSSALSSLESTVNGLKSSKAEASALSSLQSAVTALQNTVAQKQDAAGAVKIAKGNYVGTGDVGASNPNTLNFSSTLGKLPELLVLRGVGGGGDGLVLVRGMANAAMNLSGTVGAGSKVELTWDSIAKTVSWYASNAAAQFNASGYIYNWFAIA